MIIIWAATTSLLFLQFKQCNFQTVSNNLLQLHFYIEMSVLKEKHCCTGREDKVTWWSWDGSDVCQVHLRWESVKHPEDWLRTMTFCDMLTWRHSKDTWRKTWSPTPTVTCFLETKAWGWQNTRCLPSKWWLLITVPPISSLRSTERETNVHTSQTRSRQQTCRAAAPKLTTPTAESGFNSRRNVTLPASTSLRQLLKFSRCDRGVPLELQLRR